MKYINLVLTALLIFLVVFVVVAETTIMPEKPTIPRVEINESKYFVVKIDEVKDAGVVFFLPLIILIAVLIVVLVLKKWGCRNGVRAQDSFGASSCALYCTKSCCCWN